MCAGEACDDGNLEPLDGCDDQCRLEPGTSCGDGVLDAGEACDDSGESATCDDDCTMVACLDGTLNVTAGEQCDDGGESATCNADCTLAACLDGIANEAAGEDCDDGAESATCDDDCTAVACLDGTLNLTAGEECDDGAESALCDDDCTVAECLDGTLNATAGEDCDDGAESATCDADCTAVECGDNVLNVTAGEGCDDGNLMAGDGCDGSCAPECGGPLFASDAGGNGWEGNMFDVVAQTDLTITSFDGHFHTGTQEIEIYYRLGSYVGFELSSAGWTLLGAATVSGAGEGTLMPLPIAVNVAISAGQTMAFHITTKNKSLGTGNVYTTSPAGTAGTLQASDGALDLYIGVGTQYPFAGTFADRIWNGRVHYACQ